MAYEFYLLSSNCRNCPGITLVVEEIQGALCRIPVGEDRPDPRYRGFGVECIQRALVVGQSESLDNCCSRCYYNNYPLYQKEEERGRITIDYGVPAIHEDYYI